MRLYLLRHPPVAVSGICYGRSDVPLAEGWQMGLKALKAQLPTDIRLLSSPAQRCLQFARALSNDVQVDERLAELDFGRWEMLPWDKVPRAELDAWASDPIDYVGHGGESVAEMRNRVRAALDDLKQDSMWITHAGVMKLVFAEWQALPQDEWLARQWRYADLVWLDAPAAR